MREERRRRMMREACTHLFLPAGAGVGNGWRPPYVRAFAGAISALASWRWITEKKPQVKWPQVPFSSAGEPARLLCELSARFGSIRSSILLYPFAAAPADSLKSQLLACCLCMTCGPSPCLTTNRERIRDPQLLCSIAWLGFITFTFLIF